MKTVGHAGDGLASMRTHTTPVKTAGHAGDGMATMQTPNAPVKTASVALPFQLSGSLASCSACICAHSDLQTSLKLMVGSSPFT